MPPLECQISELKQAYRVIGIPLSVSAHSIKLAYRRLVKRWHPDLYPSGSPACVEATEMTKLINEAYSKIDRAPLRYYVETYQVAGTAGRSTTHPSEGKPTIIENEKIPRTDWIEFWVRFLCGGIAGAFCGFRLVLEFDKCSASLVAGAIAITLGFGFAAAR
jgi:hypothetical protein